MRLQRECDVRESWYLVFIWIGFKVLDENARWPAFIVLLYVVLTEKFVSDTRPVVEIRPVAQTRYRPSPHVQI